MHARHVINVRSKKPLAQFQHGMGPSLIRGIARPCNLSSLETEGSACRDSFRSDTSSESTNHLQRYAKHTLPTDRPDIDIPTES